MMIPPLKKATDDLHFRSASLVAFPCPESEGFDHETIMDGVLKRKPFLFNVFQTAFGNIGCICIPIVDRCLFDNLNETVQATLDGMVFAAQCGATMVSCTGMIPASTNGLLAVKETMETSGFSRQFPTFQLTTGHETVVAACVLNMEHVCHIVGRDLHKEDVTFVGLGHIGSAVLELLLRLHYRPRSVHLVDIASKEHMLHAWHQRLVKQYNYQGNIEIITVDPASSLPLSLYDKTTCIMGATSSPHAIDIDCLKPGTMIVDDSFPLGFDTKKAIHRLQQHQDIVITIAGGLTSPHAVNYARSYLTGDTVTDAIFSQIRKVAAVDPFSLTSCVYSSVLINHFDLPWRLGKVDPDNALRHYECYKEHAFHGTPIYIVNLTPEGSGVHFIDAEALDYFRQHFSRR
jgi:predicted amino acid dehydrogenase